MRMMSLVAAGVLAAASSMGAVKAAEQSPSPVVGVWVLCQDPDGSPKDSLQFFEEGYGFSRRANAAMSPFLYKEAAGRLLLAVNAKGNLLTVYLRVAPDYSQLIFKSERTGKEALYVRAGQEEQYGCTAK